MKYEELVSTHPLVDRLIDKIRAASDLPGGGRVPGLVLLGDIFDLSVAPFSQVQDNVRKFIAQICEAGLFDVITSVPGNYDYHMWIQIMEYSGSFLI